MISIDAEKWMGKRGTNGNVMYYREGSCLSTDTKPTDGWANGSVLLEMDTKKVYVFDAENEVWREL